MSTEPYASSDPMAPVYEKAANDVVRDLRLVLDEPALDPSPTELARFKWLDLRWYDKSSRALEALGFRVLRDLDATALTAEGAPPSAVRVMLSEDGRTSAAIYQAIPKSPGFFVKLLLRVFGKWTVAKVVELTSYSTNGLVLNTSNQGEVNHFTPAPNCKRRSLPLGTSPQEVWEAHQAHIAAENVTLQSFSDFDPLNAAREAQRARQTAWRREVGLLPEELDRMLAPHGANGVALRPYIEKALREREDGG